MEHERITTIQIRDSVRRSLIDLKRGDDTYSDVIEKLIISSGTIKSKHNNGLNSFNKYGGIGNIPYGPIQQQPTPTPNKE